jgi:hypothetical protein
MSFEIKITKAKKRVVYGGQEGVLKNSATLASIVGEGTRIKEEFGSS